MSPHGTAGCTTFCKTGTAHKPAFCPRLKSGEITEAILHKKKLCTGCLGPKDGCPQNCQNKKTMGKAGKPIWKTCPTCNKNKGLQIHQQCRQGAQGAQGSNTRTPFVPQPRGRGGAAANDNAGRVNGPPVTLSSNAQLADITELRTEVNVLRNPNPVGTSSELVDYAIVEAPDGT